MLGCYLPTDNTRIVIGATRLKSVVTTRTTTFNNQPSTNIHNNVSWYYIEDYSIGFAPEGAFLDIDRETMAVVTIMLTIVPKLDIRENIVCVGLSTPNTECR